MTANPSEKLLLNSTQIPNILFEWMPNLSGNEFMVLMVIARQTYGWHKEIDRISYSQLQEKTGLARATISSALKTLKDLNLITVYEEGQDLSYSINTSSKSELATSSKIEHTKETNTKEIAFTKVNEQAQGIKKLGELIKARPLTRILPKPSDNKISQGFQFYAYKAADIAGLKNGGRARLFQIFKANNHGEFQVKKTAEVIKHPTFQKLPDEQAKAAYLAGAYRRSL